MFFQTLLCLLSHGSLSEVQVSEPPSLNCKRIINFFHYVFIVQGLCIFNALYPEGYFGAGSPRGR